MVVCLQQKQNSHLKLVLKVWVLLFSFQNLKTVLENFMISIFSKESLHKIFGILNFNLSEAVKSHICIYLKVCKNQKNSIIDLNSFRSMILNIIPAWGSQPQSVGIGSCSKFAQNLN
jgi:hypothetical protein